MNFSLRGTLAHEIIGLPHYWLKMAQVETRSLRAVRLGYGPHARQYVWVCRPEGDIRGWVVYFHGGGWRYGSPERFLAAARVLRRHGLGAILPSYRRTPRFCWREIREDVSAGLQVARDWIMEQELPRPVLLSSGMSAGGHLAAMVALDKTITEESGWADTPFGGAFCCGAVLDFYRMPDNFILRTFAGRCGDELFHTANPYDVLERTSAPPPFLILHGQRDGMAPYVNAYTFYQRFEALFPQRADLHVIPDGTHLDAGRWMFRENEERRAIQRFVEEQLERVGAR